MVPPGQLAPETRGKGPGKQVILSPGKRNASSQASTLHGEGILSLFHGGDRSGERPGSFLGRGEEALGTSHAQTPIGVSLPKDWFVGFCNFPISGKGQDSNPGSRAPKPVLLTTTKCHPLNSHLIPEASKAGVTTPISQTRRPEPKDGPSAIELGLEPSFYPQPGLCPHPAPHAGRSWVPDPQGLTLSRGAGFESQGGPEAGAVIEAPALLYLGGAGGLTHLLAARGGGHRWRRQVLLGGARPSLGAAHADAVLDGHPAAGRAGRVGERAKLAGAGGGCAWGHR